MQPLGVLGATFLVIGQSSITNDNRLRPAFTVVLLRRGGREKLDYRDGLESMAVLIRNIKTG